MDILDELVSGIAQALDEPGRRQRAQIRRLIEALGAKTVLTYAERAKAIDKQAAILVCRGHRFRTLGGIFFYIIRDDPQFTDETRLACFRPYRYANKTKTPGSEPEVLVSSNDVGDAALEQDGLTPSILAHRTPIVNRRQNDAASISATP